MWGRGGWATLPRASRLARLLGARAEVEPPVDDDAREVVRAEDEEGDLGRLGLDEDAEELRDEEGAEGRDRRRPAEDGRRLRLVEDDADLAEGRAVADARAVEDDHEADEERREVGHAVGRRVARGDADEAEADRRGGEED